METKQIVADKNLIAKCGLYCGACRSYLKGKCPGCKENIKATWCKTRLCCIESNYSSCADCDKIELMDCKKFNNLFSKLFGLILRSDRPACIQRIKEIGYEQYAEEMATNKRQSIKRK
jgi:hypothetical protein